MKLVKHCCILSYFFLIPLFLVISIALTVTNSSPACLFDSHVHRINLGTLGAALTSCCTGHAWCSMPLSCSISDSTSTVPSSLPSFGLFKSPFQLSKFLVSEMLSGAQSSTLSTKWRLIHLIRWTFSIWVRPPERSFADKAGSIGDLSDDVNAATRSCWMSDQDAFTISSVSAMYPTAVICLNWRWHCFWVARWYWMPCHISKSSWTLAIQCNLLSSTSFFISELFSVFVKSNAGSSHAKILWLAWASCLMTTILRRVSPVDFDCLAPIPSRPRDNWPALKLHVVW